MLLHPKFWQVKNLQYIWKICYFRYLLSREWAETRIYLFEMFDSQLFCFCHFIPVLALCFFFSLTVGEFYILNKQTYIPHILWMLVLNLNIFPHSEMSYASLFLFFFHLVNYGILSSDFFPSRLNITLADDRCFNSVAPMGSVTWGAASAHVAPSLSTEKETTSIYYWIEPDLNLFADK